MSKYRKGRVLVLAGMVGFSSLTVLAGTGATQEWKGGKLEVSYSPTFPKVKGKMKNVLPNACVAVRTSKFKLEEHGKKTVDLTASLRGHGAIDKARQSGITADFYGKQFDAPANSTYYLDLTKFIATAPVKNNKKIEKKGYHVELTIGKKHKSFWVWASGAGIGCPTVGGTSAAPGDNDPVWNAPDRIPSDWTAEVNDPNGNVVDDSGDGDGGGAVNGGTSGGTNGGGGTHVATCKPSHFVRASWNITPAYPGNTASFSIAYDDPQGLVEGSDQLSVDGQDIDMNDVVVSTDSRGNDVAVISGTWDVPPTGAGAHTVEASAENENGQCSVVSTTFTNPDMVLG